MLSGSFHWIHLSLGAAASFTVAWINSGHSPFVPNFRIWGKTILFLPWLFVQIIKSSLHVTKLILNPNLPIAPKLLHVKTNLNNRAAVVLLGNSITLTPGTITAEVDASTLIVHALDDVSSEDVRSGRLESKIASVFEDGGKS